MNIIEITRAETDKKKPIALSEEAYALYQTYKQLIEAINNLARKLK